MTTGAAQVDLTTGRDQAEVAERVQQAGTSFYWAMRLLPRAKREAMFAVYAFCRAVDDIADGDLPADRKIAALAAWRAEIERLYAGAPGDPVARALSPSVARFGLRKRDFLAVIDGVEMDARGPIVAPPMAELELYCGRVAGAVGCLSVRIFGAPQPAGDRLAAELGEAVQLTNLLRDVAEDAAVGRLYLPRELLAEAGVPAIPGVARDHPRVAQACEQLAERAEARFQAAARTLAGLSRRDLKPARIIHAIYHRLLERLRDRGFRALEPAVRLGRWEKLAIALRNLL
jgi:presqualene diphosphate synthase